MLYNKSLGMRSLTRFSAASAVFRLGRTEGCGSDSIRSSGGLADTFGLNSIGIISSSELINSKGINLFTVLRTIVFLVKTSTSQTIASALGISLTILPKCHKALGLSYT